MKTLLIAEPDRAARGVLRQYFENRGYQVYDCGSAQEVAKIAQRVRPHITLVAQEIWGASPVGHAARLEATSRTTVVFMMRTVSDSFLEQLDRLKVFSYIKKPASMAEVYRTVEFAVHTGARIEVLKKRVNHLEKRMEHKKAIDNAKRILMQNKGVSEPEAHKYLRKKSMDCGKPIHAVAQEICDWGAQKIIWNNQNNSEE